MEGRWTIEEGRLAGGWPEPSACPIPVVPCDDAAIERAEAALHRDYISLSNKQARMVAEAVLRAAGETP